jgi:hypothetical protein
MLVRQTKESLNMYSLNNSGISFSAALPKSVKGVLISPEGIERIQRVMQLPQKPPEIIPPSPKSVPPEPLAKKMEQITLLFNPLDKHDGHPNEQNSIITKAAVIKDFLEEQGISAGFRVSKNTRSHHISIDNKKNRLTRMNLIVFEVQSSQAEKARKVLGYLVDKSGHFVDMIKTATENAKNVVASLSQSGKERRTEAELLAQHAVSLPEIPSVPPPPASNIYTSLDEQLKSILGTPKKAG